MRHGVLFMGIIATQLSHLSLRHKIMSSWLWGWSFICMWIWTPRLFWYIVSALLSINIDVNVFW